MQKIKVFLVLMMKFWYYSKNSQKFGIYFLNGKVVGISATDSKTKLSGPVNSLTIN